MMKKHFLKVITATTTLAIMLCACSNSNSMTESTNPTTVSEEERSNEEVSPEDSEPDIESSKGDSSLVIDMSNTNNQTSYFIKDGWLYGLSWDSQGYGLFQKMRLDGTDKTIIKSMAEPHCIRIKDEYIYVILACKQKEDTGIYKMLLSGDKAQLLVHGACDEFQIYDNQIYYTKIDEEKNTHYYYKCDLNGENESVILQKDIYYPYIINDNLIYQDDGDGEVIKKYNLQSKEETILTNTYSYAPILNRNYLYYIKNDNSINTGDTSGVLCKLNIKTREEVELYDAAESQNLALVDDNLYFLNSRDGKRLYSINTDGDEIKLISQDDYLSQLYVNINCIMYIDRDSDYNLVDAFQCQLDGAAKDSLVHSSWSNYE